MKVRHLRDKFKFCEQKEYWGGGLTHSYLMTRSLILMMLLVSGVVSPLFSHGIILAKDDIQLSEALNKLSKKYEVFFSYDENTIEDVEVSYQPEQYRNIEHALNELLAGTSLRYKIFDNRYIILYEESQEALSSLKGMVRHLESVIDSQEEISNTRKKDRPISLLGPSVQIKIKPVAFTVLGTVVDQSGEPLIGVNVQVKGTNKGTATDFDGRFTLEDVNENAILVFSYIGYQTVEIPLDARQSIEVIMIADSELLDEVVVVGYGTQKKSDLTGSVASINTEKLLNFPVTGVEQILAGQASGVHVQQSTGAPGSSPIIRVRGVGSITAGNGPLYVIDGFVGAGNLNNINVNDIESIEILKDASATAIYGSRGSNGVILITTKGGTQGKPNVEFNIYTGFQQLPKKYDVLNAEQWVEFVVEARDNSWVARGGNPNDPNEVRPPAYQYPEEFNNPSSFGEGTDYQDAIFQTAPIQNYSLSVSGGSENSSYFVSGNYFTQDGLIKTSGFDRYSFRINADFDISDRIKFGVNFAPSYTEENYVNAEGHWSGNGAVLSALNLPPIFPLYESDGSYGSLVEYGWDFPSIPSPLVPLYEMDDVRKRLNLLGVAHAGINIFEGFDFRASINANLRNYRRDTYRSSQAERDGRPAPQPPEATSGTSQSLNLLFESTLNYSRTLNFHIFDVLIGYTAQSNRFEDNEVFATNFPNDLIHTINAGQVTSGSGTANEWSLLSYIGRFNYSYNSKYLLTATVRRDGSSRFGSANKWGVFPSFALGWRITQEKFMEQQSFFDEIKLRASYGFTGNNLIPNYGHIGLVNIDNYIFGDGIANGVAPRSFSNERLGWERKRQLDIGLNIGILNNRINFEMDHYISYTNDLLLNVPVPSHTGYTNSLQNIGEVKNIGWEFSLTSRNTVSELKWSTSINLSTNQNEVLALGPEGDPIITNPNITQIGHPIGSFLGYIFEGIYNTYEEIESRPHLSTDRPGDPIIRDVNNDGIISPDDRTILGSNQPDFIFGVTNSFTYKNFDLNVLIRGTAGNYVYSRQYSWLYLTTGFMNVSSELLNRWRSAEDPGNGMVPHAFADVQGYRRQPSTLWITNASFLRIDNINLGYNIPRNFANRMMLQGARIYCHIQNLWTFTEFPGFNPEVSNSDDPLSSGWDFGGYPVPRTFTLGLSVKF